MNALSKTLIALLLAALSLCGACAVWAGASLYAGERVYETLQALAKQPEQNAGMRFANLQHTKGWFSSAGQIELHMQEECEAPSTSPLVLLVNYQVSHVVLPTAWVRFDWQVQPLGDAGQTFAELFGAHAQLAGRGSVTLFGEVQSDFALPRMLAQRGRESIELSPSQGEIRWGEQSLALQWHADNMRVQSIGQEVRFEQLAIAMDLSHRQRGIGTTQLTLQKIESPLANAQGLRVLSRVNEHADRLDMQLMPSIDRVDVLGVVAQDLVLELALRDLHAPSVETMSRIAGETCGLQQMQADEAAQLRHALRALLHQGFTFEIARIAGKVGDGALDGRLVFRWLPTPADQTQRLPLAQLLQTSAHLRLTGQALDAEQRQLAILFGLGQATPNGLECSVEYADGVLRANGRLLDASTVQRVLAQADQELQQLLDRAITPIAPGSPEMAPPQTAPPAPTPNEPLIPSTPPTSPVTRLELPAVS